MHFLVVSSFVGGESAECCWFRSGDMSTVGTDSIDILQLSFAWILVAFCSLLPLALGLCLVVWQQNEPSRLLIVGSDPPVASFVMHADIMRQNK